jgi:signal transduction histidine kinase
MIGISEVARRLVHSLFARLVLIFLVASVAYGFAARHAYSLFQDFDYLRRIAGAHVVLHSEYILKDLGTPPSIERAEEIIGTLPVDIRIIGPDMDWSSTPDFYPLDEIFFSPQSIIELGEAGGAEVEPWFERLGKVEFARHKDHAIVKLSDGDYEIIFVSPRVREVPGADYTTWIVALIGLLILLACYLAVRWLITPIAWMQEGAARIGSGDLDYRIPTPRHDELGELSRDINAMAGDVKGMLDAKQQLMLAISHELRSPITRAKVAVEFVAEETVRSGILQDLDEMERLITDLLESEALNTRYAILHRESVELGGLVQSVVELDFASRNERINLQVQQGLPEAQLDATRIRLLSRNLLDNALRYNPTDADPVEVSVDRQHDRLTLSVRDHGPGIPAEHLDYVTEPFYRADPARSRATGGVGLGLYLCRRVVEAHGGELTIDSAPERGTTIRAALPL